MSIGVLMFYQTNETTLSSKQKMKLKNLTPHPLTIVGENGTIQVPPSGQLARLAVTRTALDPVNCDGVTLPVSRPTMGEITGLPPAEEGVMIIVSALVAEAANRADVYSPGELIRSADGAVIGAKGICSYKEGR
jgi:hypothetical protein